jgi:NAD(P)-dependent dehydrogenase (short-subunit alcohol dehydrogenase family)
MTEANAPVWFITGCSSGFGSVLAEAVLARGWRVAATARDPGTLAGLVAAREDRALALALDVTDPDAIATALAETVGRFGRIDVLVNNAGYGYAASIEEGRPDEIRAMFETNVFGLAETIRQALPILRAQKSGWIVNLSSMGGIVGNPGTGYYAASKFAVEGLSDALAKEVAPFGIRVLIVEPGPFRTRFRASVRRTPVGLAGYEATVGNRLKALSEPGTAPGDPERAAEAIIAAVTSENPPLRLLLGAQALKVAREKLAAMAADFDAWEEVTLAADGPPRG